MRLVPFPVYLLGTETTTTVNGTVPKQVACEKCGYEYVYLLSRDVSRSAFSWLHVNNQDAADHAQQRAEIALEKEMWTIAREKGWGELIRQTWFCHLPRRNSQPCGICNPCRCAMADGFGWRIPLTKRARLWMRSAVTKCRSVLFPRRDAA